MPNKRMTARLPFFPTVAPAQVGPPRRGRPAKPKPLPWACFDENDVRIAAQCIAEVMGEKGATETLSRSIAEAWAAYRSIGILVKRGSELSGGAPRTAFAGGVFLSDIARALEREGHRGAISGDTEHGGRSPAVKLADTMVRQITGRGLPMSNRAIREGRRLKQR